LATRGAQRIGGESGDVALEAAMVWGLGRAIALEHPELQCKCVDLDPAREASDADLASLFEHASAAGDDENQIALRRGERFALRLARSSRADIATVNAGPICRADGAYLVTGGLAGIGLRVAEWLVERGARHVVVMGRRQPS